MRRSNPARWTGVMLGSCLLVLSAAEASAPRAIWNRAEAGHPGKNSRAYHFRYESRVQNVPVGAEKARVWVPLPQSDNCQVIREIRIESPSGTTSRTEERFGNHYAYVEVAKPDTAFPVVVTFDVVRHEDCPDVAALVTGGDGKDADLSIYTPFLEPDALGAIDDRIRTLTAQTIAGQTTTMGKARAIYDYVLSHMTYDKSGTGWGRGDTNFACDVGKGNCTDFHALFISMARAAGIPAVFEMGFPLPDDKTEGGIGGYHCWAKFHVPGHGWIPVDISEADKHPDKAEYFFGHLCPNRVGVTVGRDLRLEPMPSVGALNFLIYPYVEVDGRAHTAIQKKFAFKNAA